jgi:arsenite methyltransferase
MPANIREVVREKYASVAQGGLSSHLAEVRAVAEAFGYTPEELASIPAEANMGLSCGNPTAFASLKLGETVVDLGCGGGLDVFLAAQKVGPTGKAIGIDMTPEMLELARRNAAKSEAQHVEFHQATIDKLPLLDASVDCVISNCVISPEAGWTACCQRHRSEETTPLGDRPELDGLCRLHCRGDTHRRVSTGFD